MRSDDPAVSGVVVGDCDKRCYPACSLDRVRTVEPSPDHQHESSFGGARLSPVERQVLSLLAQGHTAKSIAMLIGSSVGAVNERLRTARRKTGVSSSRELARRLQPQEICDEKFGLAAVPETDAPSTWTAERRLFLVGVLFVTILISVMSATLIWAPADVAKPQIDPERVLAGSTIPMPEALPPAGSEPRHFAALFFSEARDAAWAIQSEARIREAYASAGPLIAAQELTTVRCASTLCQVAGNSVSQTSETAALAEANARSTLAETLDHLGLRPESTSFRSSESDPALIAFVAYYSRAGN